MLRSVIGLEGVAIAAADGEIGRVVDLRFDLASWAVRGLVVEAGRPTLISPRLLGPVDDVRRVVPTSLTRAQILASPRPDADRGAESARELTEYFALGLDEEIGRVTDLLVEDQVWAIRHLVVAVDESPGARRVVVPVGWVSWVSIEARSVMLALRRSLVRAAPTYGGSGDLPPDDARLAAHYGRAPFVAGVARDSGV